MSDKQKIPNDLPIFADLTDGDLKSIEPFFEELGFDENVTIFQEGDGGSSMFVIKEGAVQINTKISGDVDKTLITLRKGGIFGELSLVLADEFRSASAVAIQKAELLSISKENFAKILEDHTEIGRKILQFLTRLLAERVRNTTTVYKQAVEWGISISGILEINFNELISEQVNLNLELNNGKSVAGTLLKAEKGAVGYELLIKTMNDEFNIIPYHAVSSISFSRKELKSREGQ